MNEKCYNLWKFNVSLIADNYGKLHLAFSERNSDGFVEIQKHGKPKVYILMVDNKIQYVGTTTQKQTTRLWQGLNGKYSYKWKGLKNQNLPLTLIVICFKEKSEEFIFNEKGDKYLEIFKANVEELIKIRNEET